MLRTVRTTLCHHDRLSNAPADRRFVDPMLTVASAAPSRTRRAATRTVASRRERTARTGSSSIRTHCRAATTPSRSGWLRSASSGPAVSGGPTKVTAMSGRRPSASSAPSTTTSGARSPPSRSTAMVRDVREPCAPSAAEGPGDVTGGLRRAKARLVRRRSPDGRRSGRRSRTRCAGG